MYFLCTLQPDLEETRRVGYIGEWMTKAEKRDAIQRFYKTKQHIPLSVDHTAPKEFGAAIPPKERVGRVLDLFNDRNGDLIAKCVIYKGSGALGRLNSGTYLRGEKWGVSVRIDWVIVYGPDGAGQVDKTLTHVALTLNPYLAKEGTYVHHWHTNERVVDRAIHEKYYREGDGECFAAPELINKMRDAVAAHQQQQQQGRIATTARMSEESSNAMMVENNNTNSASVQPQATTTAATQQQPQQGGGNSVAAAVDHSSTRLVDLEAQLKEMDDMISDGIPLQRMPAKFRAEYLAKMDQIEAKKKEIAAHFKYMIDNKLLSPSEAAPYLDGIDSSDLNGKRAIYGYIEASREDHMRTVAASAAKFRELEENNKRLLAEKDRELESMKKKIRLNEYMAPTMPEHKRYEDQTSAPLPRDTIDLLQLKSKSGDADVVNREVIHDASLRSLFDYDITRQTSVAADSAPRYNKLVAFMEQWSTKAL